MSIDLEAVQKPIRELRKSLKRMALDPSEKDVHNLRTRSRRLEAVVTALTPEHSHSARKLVKGLKPLRKSAGAVRDMDVLTTKALALVGQCRSTSLKRLVEHLTAMRIEAAGELHSTVAKKRNQVRRRLKRFLKKTEGELFEENTKAGAATRLANQLSHWPALGEQNLHAFRIQVKELRYILQLAPNADAKFMKALDRAKTEIGDWHDWQELNGIAARVLDRTKNRNTFERIAAIQRKKFERALNSAHVLRTRYLGVHGGQGIAEP